MDELKREAWVGKSTPTSINRPPSFDPLRFVATATIRTRKVLIAELAYFRALNRGFEPGHEVEDWLEAEAEFEKRHGARHARCEQLGW
ncbi:MAG: DUF2934 domain-containing protein [Pseudomonadota bacterium]|nr:DUF2934 domain-containing protein [Pseudomonadota bacterium]